MHIVQLNCLFDIILVPEIQLIKLAQIQAILLGRVYRILRRDFHILDPGSDGPTITISADATLIDRTVLRKGVGKLTEILRVSGNGRAWYLLTRNG